MKEVSRKEKVSGQEGPSVERELTIGNRLGLHARPAARLAEVAVRFASEIWLEKNGEVVDAKSVVHLLSLGCAQGARVLVRATGADSEQALEALSKVIEENFGEE